MAGGPERHRRKCNSIFANLIAIREERDMRACEYVNEFFETMRCDDIYDMSVHRNELETRIGKEALGRILACDDTEKDEKLASRALIHYHDWHKKQLMSAVDWRTWIKIHTLSCNQHNGDTRSDWVSVRCTTTGSAKSEEDQRQGEQEIMIQRG